MFGLASERENGGRRRRNRRRKEIKGKLDNRMVIDVAAGKIGRAVKSKESVYERGK